MPQKPENLDGQPPTRSARETEDRLREKAREMRGEADRSRTQEQIEELRSRSLGRADPGA